MRESDNYKVLGDDGMTILIDVYIIHISDLEERNYIFQHNN